MVITSVPNQQVVVEEKVAVSVTEFFTWVSFSYNPGHRILDTCGVKSYLFFLPMSTSTGRGRGMAIWGRVYGGGSDHPSVITSSNSTPKVNQFMH